MEFARAMIFDAGLKKTDWHHAIKAAAYLINRSTYKANPENHTPYKMFHSNIPNISNLKIFGCIAYHHIDEAIRKQKLGTSKLDPRATPRLHIGYTENGYVLIDLKTKGLFRSCNVHHIENENKQNLLKILENEKAATDLFRLFSDEQLFLDSEALDHSYSMALVSDPRRREKLSDNKSVTYDDAMNSAFSDE